MTFGAGGLLLSGKPAESTMAKLKVTQVSVMAARTFNHPYEQYSNFRPSVTMVAEVTKGQKAEEIVYALQQAAEKMAENHKQRILGELEQMYRPTDEEAQGCDEFGW